MANQVLCLCSARLNFPALVLDAGGDTASRFAAGCSRRFKGRSSPRTADRASSVAAACRACGDAGGFLAHPWGNRECAGAHPRPATPLIRADRLHRIAGRRQGLFDLSMRSARNLDPILRPETWVRESYVLDASRRSGRARRGDRQGLGRIADHGREGDSAPIPASPCRWTGQRNAFITPPERRWPTAHRRRCSPRDRAAYRKGCDRVAGATGVARVLTGEAEPRDRGARAVRDERPDWLAATRGGRVIRPARAGGDAHETPTSARDRPAARGQLTATPAHG